ncbi:MAG: AsnC family transcriptional regulator [Alphaproteobacteria bacterium]|nr:MAG: AsnC family transcriptional regulator [Alphaproteobacteria bacterium]
MMLDRADKMILRELQANARISNVELAEKVGLSPSACSRRLHQLEQAGIIEGYQAVISNRALGQTITALVHITLKAQSEDHLRKFETAVLTCPYIVACFLMSGESDYLIRVNARDMEHYEQIYKNWLSTLPGVSRIQSSFAMRMVVNRPNIDLATIDERGQGARA